MKPIKSERLKKFEAELKDLEQWLKLGLVPKKDIEKHKAEMVSLGAKIEEEKERLRFLKESGDVEEYVAPKRGQMKPGYSEVTTMPDLETMETGGVAESSFDMENEQSESEATTTEYRDEEEVTGVEYGDEESQDEESYFSDRNRWRRGGIVDPDADEW